jgi:hypothetical protein
MLRNRPKQSEHALAKPPRDVRSSSDGDGICDVSVVAEAPIPTFCDVKTDRLSASLTNHLIGTSSPEAAASRSSLGFYFLATLPIAEFLNYLAPGNRMKLGCIHIVICHQKTAEPRIVRVQHPLSRLRVSACMK